MSRRTLLLTFAAALAAWMGIAYLLLALDVGSMEGLLHPLRLVYYLLAIAAPAITFFPLARLLGMRTWGFEATLSWTGLVLLVTFLQPDVGGLPAYLLCMLLYFGAVASVLLPVGYALGFKLLTLRVHRRDTGRARREAYLGALFVTLSTAMNVGGFLNPLNALLLALILVLVESFALAHKPGAELY